MTVVRKFHPEVRLKKMLAEPGGMKVSQALEQAASNLEEIKEDCLLAIDEKIAQLAVLFEKGGEDELERSYYVANEIFAEAGAFEQKEVSAAAHSLCVLLSADDLAALPKAALAVHVDTLRALRSQALSGDAKMRGAVLAQLQAMTAKLTG